MNTQTVKYLQIGGEDCQHNEEDNTLFFDDMWLVIEKDERGDKYVITYAGNIFYLDN